MREIVVHLHCGTRCDSAVAQFLQKSFGDKFRRLEPNQSDLAIDRDRLETFLVDHPHLRAISVHRFQLPLPPRTDWEFFPILFLQRAGRDAFTIGFTEESGRSDGVAFIEGGLTPFIPLSPGRLQNFYTTCLSGVSNPDARHLEQAKECLKKLKVFGIVEKVDQSVEVLSRNFGSRFPELDLSALLMQADGARSLPGGDRSIPNSTSRTQSGFTQNDEDLDLQLYEFALRLFEERHQLTGLDNSEVEVRIPIPFPAGHFYSPLPASDDVRRAISAQDEIDPLAGIDMREPEQMQFLTRLANHYSELPYSLQPESRFRFALMNPAYSFGDAIPLFCLLRELQPRRLIEIGSGYSSCLVLDTNELFFQNRIDCTFIEPYPKRLYSLLRPGDIEQNKILTQKVQDTDLALFATLGKNDILLIDSSHVMKAGSDLQTILFRILPVLQRGVVIHFHDFFERFEYPARWLLEGRAWNEQYLVRAFLQYNREFRIKLFLPYLRRTRLDWFTTHMPWVLRKPSGSLWIERA